MMPPITFYAAGLPKGQPRPKAFARGGHASVYDPATAEGWKSQVAEAAKSHLPTIPLAMPLQLHLEFFMPRPSCHYTSGNRSRPLKAAAPGYHTGKPDADNLAKAVMDALTILRMWHDDAQVADLRVRKLYTDGRPPGCLITIREA